jgi:hypothetical protein
LRSRRFASARRIAFRITSNSPTPIARSTTTIPNAISGSFKASATTRATVPSSPRLTLMFEKGSGEALIPSLRPALIAWLVSAVAPAPPPASTSFGTHGVVEVRELDSDHAPDRRPDQRVQEVPGVVEVGTLSVTNSIAYITPAPIITESVVGPSGTSPNPARPSSPSSSTVP